MKATNEPSATAGMDEAIRDHASARQAVEGNTRELMAARRALDRLKAELEKVEKADPAPLRISLRGWIFLADFAAVAVIVWSVWKWFS